MAQLLLLLLPLPLLPLPRRVRAAIACVKPSQDCGLCHPWLCPLWLLCGSRSAQHPRDWAKRAWSSEEAARSPMLLRHAKVLGAHLHAEWLPCLPLTGSALRWQDTCKLVWSVQVMLCCVAPPAAEAWVHSPKNTCVCTHVNGLVKHTPWSSFHLHACHIWSLIPLGPLSFHSSNGLQAFVADKCPLTCQTGLLWLRKFGHRYIEALLQPLLCILCMLRRRMSPTNRAVMFLSLQTLVSTVSGWTS